MYDILPDSIGAWHRLEEAFRTRFARYGYQEIRTPIVEETRLFARSVGEATDIVGKEMYTFRDKSKKGRDLCLRPEATASAARAYVQHSLHQKEPTTKWWYIGPMYRYERVQTGRYRQFHQVGCEAFGSADPAVDAELLVMLDGLLRQDLGLGELELRLNSLGDPESRPAFVKALKTHLATHLGELCEDCQRRYEQNPLRTLDCKVESCQPILDEAPKMLEFLSEEARAHFDAVQALLGDLGVSYTLWGRLVRGLDYYNRTCFEFVAGGLGAQDTVCGGGRYDRLVKQLGGPDTPAVGFAMGLERLVMVLPEGAWGTGPGVAVSVVPLDDEAFRVCFRLVERLRGAGLHADLDLRRGSLKSQMRRADKLGARYAVVIGEDELASGRVRLKDLRTEGAEDVEVDLEALADEIRSRLS